MKIKATYIVEMEGELYKLHETSNPSGSSIKYYLEFMGHLRELEGERAAKLISGEGISDDTRLGGYTKAEWIQMIDDNVVQPSDEVLEFIKS